MTEATVPSPATDEALVEPRVRELLNRYVALSGASLAEIAPQLYQLTVPTADAGAFAGRSCIRLAFTLEALQSDPRSEMAIIGSAFVNQLIEAARLRGSRLTAGLISSADTDTTGEPAQPVRVRDCTVSEPVTRFARHRVGRLIARVVIRAGSAIDEQLVESALHDLSTGAPVGQDLAALCVVPTSSATDLPVESDRWKSVPEAEVRPARELVTWMLASLERQTKPRLEAIAEVADRELKQELERLDRYYAALAEDAGGRDGQVPDKEARAVFAAEHARRTREEKDRHAVQAVVHPVQLIEWEVPVQRAEWSVQTSRGRRGTFVGQRYLAGERRWALPCPHCASTAVGEIRICQSDHAGCASCTAVCAVCDEACCDAHGAVFCHVDRRSTCGDHARTCAICRRSHCVAHQGTCDETGHDACAACLAPCADCGRVVCDHHTIMTVATAPRGPRRLCRSCVRACEGGTGEFVGRDEVAGCASCARVVCENHQARCAVDGHIHCSTHLRRTDTSRRLVCEKDRATCSQEPHAILAVDEVAACDGCHLTVCDAHAGTCVVDQGRYCLSHLHAVADKRGQLACDVHTSTCHVDNVRFTVNGTRSCPCCGRLACKAHHRSCANCGRAVCTADFAAKSSVCATCQRLKDVADPADNLLSATSSLDETAGGKAKSWRVARDARHDILEIGLSWKRRVVVSVRHGDSRAERAVMHSFFGARRLIE